MTTRKPVPLVFAGVFAGVLVTDLATKVWATASLIEPVHVTDWLYLVLHRNSGVFLGTVPLSAEYWIGVCAALGWFGWRALRSTSVLSSTYLAAVLAGMTGNAVGQAQGEVIDFIGFGPVTGDVWLVANVADLALVGGVLALGLHLVRERVHRTRWLR